VRAAGAAALLAGWAIACRHPPQRPSPASPPAPTAAPAEALAEPHLEPDLLGSVHVVKRGETLYRIARTYGVEARDLMEVNDISDPRQLRPGLELFVPGARRPLEVPPLEAGAQEEPEPPSAPATHPPAAAPPAVEAPSPPPAPGAAPPRGVPQLRWPVKGVLYSRFGMRQGQRHDGIDIAAPEGSPVTAAADGEVAYAGEQPGYGHVVILRHPGGLLTLYAHMSKVLVPERSRVRAGDAIARVGQSGRTSGPHLHFEVREGTRPRNPLLYLR
jgi:murein DD-endopeptidase MepM/ murein hydrolase activator NlpD